MRTSTVLVATAGLVAARPEFLNTSFDVVQGEPFTLTFSECDNGCTITLENGPSDDLSPVDELTGSATGGSFTFTPDGLPTDTYAFRIVDNDTDEENFSSQFEVEGDAPPASSAESSAPATTEAASTTEAPETTTIVEIATASVTVSSTESDESSTFTTAVSTESVTSTVETTITSTASESASETESASSTATEEETSTAAETTGATTVPDSAAGRLASPVALIACAIGAMFLFN